MPNRILIVALGCLICIQTARSVVFDSTHVAPIKLGPGVNSTYDELKPVIAPDGTTLYFVRKNSPQNIDGTVENIWVSVRESSGSWGDASNIGSTLNHRVFNYVCSITPDGNTILLYTSDSLVKNNGMLAFSNRTTSGWSAPRRVDILGYVNNSKFREFALSNDNTAIIQAAQGKNSLGDLDLYVSFRMSNDTFSVPLNLGATVNSAGKEATPFLAADNVSLYFASDRPGGFGEFDIYVTRRLDSTWTNWSVPENLGPMINTDDWDLAYTIPADGKYAYFVSYSDSLGGADIFQVKLPEKVRPKPVVLLGGRVFNKKTNSPVEAEIVYEILSTGTELGHARSTPATGEYKITLPAGEGYSLRASAEGFLAVSDNLDFTSFTEFTTLSKDLFLVPIEKGSVVELRNIFFERKRAALQPESFAELKRVVQALVDNPTLKIEIGGHTDAMGKDSDNLTLSNDRAQAVRTYLITEGHVDADRLKAVGYGESKPVATNDTEEGRALNRRVELTILEK